MNRILIATKHHNFEECLVLARTYGVGLEIQSFAFPPLLGDPEWQTVAQTYQSILKNFPYEVTMHGAFMDMCPGSPDPLFIETTRQRTLQSLQIAQIIGATTVVFHANFIASIRNDPYRDGWIERMIQFWIPVANEAQKLNIQIVMENMWEFDPSILRTVLERVNSPHLMACLDVGHSQLYSKLPVTDWLDDLEGWITYFHINNNYGEIDEHLALDDGVMDYSRILPLMSKVAGNPAVTLEIEDSDDLQRSLVYLGIPEAMGK